MKTSEIIEQNNVKITCTNGNKANGVSGSRITVWADDGSIVDRFEVPKRNGVQYCLTHEHGKYGRRFREAAESAVLLCPLLPHPNKQKPLA